MIVVSPTACSQDPPLSLGEKLGNWKFVTQLDCRHVFNRAFAGNFAERRGSDFWKNLVATVFNLATDGLSGSVQFKRHYKWGTWTLPAIETDGQCIQLGGAVDSSPPAAVPGK